MSPAVMPLACSSLAANLPSPETMEQIDRVELALSQMPSTTCPLDHLFCPGVYLRKIFMPAMSMVTSKIHKTQHFFIVLKGTVSVKNGDEAPVVFQAPYIGVTQPGTRRVLMCHTDVEWATIHATDKENVEEIEDEILYHRDNPLMQFIEGE